MIPIAWRTCSPQNASYDDIPLDIEYEFSGIDAGIFDTGMSFAFRGVLVLELHGTKISAWRDYYDFAEISRDLGKL